SPYLFNPSTMIYTTHRIGFRQLDCYGKFSYLLAELITHDFLLNSVLFNAGRAFQSVTPSFDSSTTPFNCRNLKQPDLYRNCVATYKNQTLKNTSLNRSCLLLKVFCHSAILSAY